MILDFKNMEQTVIHHFHGGDHAVKANMFTDDLNNRIMYSRLEPGSSIGIHKHDTGSEFIYVLQGKGTVIYDDGQEEVRAGLCHYCPKGHSHSLINNGKEDLVFFGVVAQQ